MRRFAGARTRGRRPATRGVPVPDRRQRVDGGDVRTSGGRVADRRAPGCRLRIDRRRGLERSGCQRTRSVQRRSVPGTARGPWRRLVGRGADAIARLNKRDVEALFERYDADPVAGLTAALRIVLDRPDDTWPELVARGNFTETRTAALLLGEQRS